MTITQQSSLCQLLLTPYTIQTTIGTEIKKVSFLLVSIAHKFIYCKNILPARGTNALAPDACLATREQTFRSPDSRRHLLRHATGRWVQLVSNSGDEIARSAVSGCHDSDGPPGCTPCKAAQLWSQEAQASHIGDESLLGSVRVLGMISRDDVRRCVRPS